MALPSEAAFQRFLASTRVIEHLAPHSVPLPAAVGGPALQLEYPVGDLSVEAVVRAITRSLDAVGCATGPDVGLAVLANLAACRRADDDAVAHANRCLDTIHSAELNQYLVLPTDCRRDYDVSFGRLRIRPFDPEKLLYWCQRGGSSYPIDVKGLGGKTAVERERFETRLINWDVLPAARCEPNGLPYGATATAVRDAYYAAVFETHMREIPDLLRRDALVLEAGALTRVDVESLFASPLSHRIGLFHWRSADQQRTWAVLSRVSLLNFNLVPPVLITECRRWLQEAVGFSALDPTKMIDRTVETYCVLMQRAHAHRLHGRNDEATLHFVIALDLVFGVDGRSAESVARRAATVVHRSLGRPLEDQERRVKRVYEARSKYVHAGREITVVDAEEAEAIAMEALWVLLRVCGRSEIATTAEWLTKVDYVCAAMRAGRELADEEFAGLGIASETTPPPNRVNEDLSLAGTAFHRARSAAACGRRN